MRFCLVLALMILPNPTLGATEVRSGEHVDFSRLVLQFSQSQEWRFGRVDGGYELQLLDARDDFDTSAVFDFIPRTRIQSIANIASGRLFLAVDCDCHADAFEIREGRLVLDIKDGPPKKGSRFEIPLKEELEAEPEAISPAPDPVTISDATSDFPHGTLQGNHGTSKLAPTGREIPMVEKPDSTGDQIATNAADPLSPKTDGSMQKPASEIASMTVPKKTVQGAQHAKQGTGHLFGEWKSPDNTQVKTQLLMMLGRAATQGLVDAKALPDPDVMGAVGSDEILTATERPPPKAEPEIEQDGTPGFRTLTAFDRARQDGEGIRGLDNGPQECLPNTVFDLRSWGTPKNPIASGSRANLLGEFDLPNPDEILELVKHYIYMGFGIEALALLKSFDVEIQDVEFLKAMAEIVDNGATQSPVSLSNQLGCPTDAALWAALSLSKFEPQQDVNTNAILHTFSGLPLHLRRHLGPKLSERFRISGDLDTATTIRDMTVRNIEKPNTELQLLNAKLSPDHNHKEQAVAVLQNSLSTSGTHLAPAVIELINSKLATGSSVDKDTAELAEALAYEHRGTGLGRELAEIAIRGLIASGEVSKSFSSIERALGDGDIAGSVAQRLRIEAHEKNLVQPNDLEFVRIAISDEQLTESSDQKSRLVRQIIARRLVELGFPNQANATLGQNVDAPYDEEKIILAMSALKQSNATKARSYLAGMTAEQATRLRAQSYEMSGNFDLAEKLYSNIGDKKSQRNAAWRTGDWQRIKAAYETTSDAVHYAAADQALANTESDGSETEKGQQMPFQNAVIEMESSHNTRRIVEALLD